MALLQRVPMFSKLEPRHLGALAQMAHHRRYRKGQIIHYRGDPAVVIHVILAGSVKITVPWETGAELIVARRGPGDHFGLAFLDGGPHCSTAVAEEPTEALAIPGDQLLEFLREHGDAALQFAMSLSLRLRRVTDLLADMAFLDLLSRVAKCLCALAGISARTLEEVTEIPVTQKELAEMVGATREAVNKQMRRLQKMGLLKTGRRQVSILSPTGLMAIASS